MAAKQTKRSAGERWQQPKGELHKLLAKSFPKKRTASYDVFDVDWLAEQLGMTSEGIYKWLRADQLPMKAARKVVKVRGCVSELQDFLRFIA